MRFLAYAARRTVAALFTLCTLILITFVVYWSLPSTPAQFVYPQAQELTKYQLKHANELLGLDRPKAEQYVDYLWQLAHGNVGRYWEGSTLVNNDHLEQQPIGPTLFRSFRETLAIILGGAFFVVLLAIPLGALAGTRVGSPTDRVISIGTLVGVCTHPMVLGLILATTFGYGHLNLLPSGGYCPLIRGGADSCGGVHDWALHLVLPWSTFALLFLALYTRMTRASVAETLPEDYVRTARSKGASEFRVVSRHVLPSASLRVLTMVGMEIGTAIGVCIYIEAAFGISGLGSLAVRAMGGATADIDLPYTLAIVTMITVVVIVGNLIVDLLYAVLDPRATLDSPRRANKGMVGGVV
jgi:peptide/nickel transport system permease protein